MKDPKQMPKEENTQDHINPTPPPPKKRKEKKKHT